MLTTTTKATESEALADLFGTEAPCGFQAGDANLRRYVGNDPTDATDLTGLVGMDEKMTTVKPVAPKLKDAIADETAKGDNGLTTLIKRDLRIDPSGVGDSQVALNVRKGTIRGKEAIIGGAVFGVIFQTDTTDNIMQNVSVKVTYYKGNQVSRELLRQEVEAFEVDKGRNTLIDEHWFIDSLKDGETKVVMEATCDAVPGSYEGKLIKGKGYATYYNSGFYDSSSPNPGLQSKVPLPVVSAHLEGLGDPSGWGSVGSLLGSIKDPKDSIFPTGKWTRWTYSFSFDTDGDYEFNSPELGLKEKGKKEIK
jgi:hypothetical protein